MFSECGAQIISNIVVTVNVVDSNPTNTMEGILQRPREGVLGGLDTPIILHKLEDLYEKLIVFIGIYKLGAPRNYCSIVPRHLQI
jgi:hypothetical protein